MATEVGLGQPGRSIAEVAALQVEVVYPFVLLVIFGLLFGYHSIAVSKAEECDEVPKVTGPGGKPLPVTRVKVDKGTARNTTEHHFSHVSRFIFQTGGMAVLATFAVNFLVWSVYVFGDEFRLAALSAREWYSDERIVYVNGGFFFWGWILYTQIDWKDDSPNPIHLWTWICGLTLEAFLLIITVMRYGALNRPLADARLYLPSFWAAVDEWETTDMVAAVVRTCLFAGLVFLYTCLSSRGPNCLPEIKEEDSRPDGSDDENTPLLSGRGTEHENGNGHGVARRRNGDSRHVINCAAAGPGPHRDEYAAFYRPDKLPHRSWWEYLRGYHVFFPYLWPSKKARLQLITLVCFILVAGQRAVNVLVPLQLGKVVETLTVASESSDYRMPWREVFVFLGLKMVQGPSGLLGSLRAMIWIPVAQNSYLSLQTAAFEHVHSLSLDFHLGKRTGEVLSALNKGGSVNSFMEQTTFQMAPMVLDLLVAIGFFWAKFGPFYALWATIITFAYLVLTIRMASTRADQRRDMVNADREEDAIKNDSITSYETVKYFNAEGFEFGRYRKAIGVFQKAEAKVTMGMSIMNMCQSLVFMCGMLVVMLIAAYEVTDHKRTVGDFVMVMTYLNQLQGPLNFFGTFYRTVQQAMISGERLLELFKIQPTVVDRKGVPPIQPCQGHIKWQNVDFGYDDYRPALKDISFECIPGTTTAFVGESGGGKSTIFRLMFRYYNCSSGAIEIDGHNVKDVTIDSVRRAIGVVPQDTILFNETIMFNLKYANQNVSDEEVYEACRAASIHDRIMSFPDGYSTKVGDRGLRLSGGEKQRVAIARTILKKPKIIMLDEATSALDSETEQEIQARLLTGNNLSQDRTLLVIAHRLSTITHAEQIIVLHQGRIVEKGTHAELLGKRGRYFSMWEKQAKAEQAAKLAHAATRKARKMLQEARIAAKDSGDDRSDRSDGGESMASSTVLPLPSGPTTPATEQPGPSFAPTHAP